MVNLIRMKSLNAHCTGITVLTTVILNKPQVREMCPHVTLDAMERACMRGEMGRQNRGEMALLVSEGGRWMAGVHGDRLCFHWRNDKSEPVEREHAFKCDTIIFSCNFYTQF